ncbi:MAG: hypothetical protein AAGE01_03120 [Pseudomonadota bacterium]
MVRLLACVTLLLCIATTSHAEVLEADDTTMVFRFEVTVPATAADAFDAFTDDVGQWWNADHTYSLDSSHLSMDDNCFCERWDGGVVRHLEIVQSRPGVMLRLLGGLGPLQGMPLSGVMDVQFSATNVGTVVVLTYTVHGRGFTNFAEPVNGVIGDQIERFRRHVAGE